MAKPTVEAPDILATVISYLNTNLTPPVASKVPNPRPATFVTVRRTGGPRATRVSDLPQLTVECWAANDIAAYDLANEVRALLEAMADGTKRATNTVVYRYDEFSGPAFLPDPDSEQDRVTWTCSLHARNVA